MTITICIDWLSVTFKEHTHDCEAFLCRYTRSNPTVSATPRFGYSDARTDAMGVLSLWHNDYAAMGLHEVFSGSTLRNLFERSGVASSEILESAIDAGGRITRLDLALDAQDEQISLSNIAAALNRGENTGTSRAFSEIKSNDSGHTIYVGSRQSEKFIRIYDKAAQEGLTGNDWKRFEIETKGDVSRALSHMLATNDDWGSVFTGLAKGMLTLRNCDDYAAWFLYNKVETGLPKIEKQTDREAWIDTQVTSAIAKHLIEHPDSVAVKRLMDTLNLIYKQQSGRD